MISTRVYYKTFALITTKACVCEKSFLDKRKFREQAFFFIEKKKIYSIKRSRNHLSYAALLYY